MPDHIHAFVALGPHSIPLSKWLKSMENAISKTLINANIQKPQWKKGFFDQLLQSTDSYKEKWAYVRENPVRAGLVANAQDWPYAGTICN